MSRTQELEKLQAAFGRFLQGTEDKSGAFIAHYESVYQDGLFDAKTKRLMAMLGGIISGCKGCILGQANYAIQHGATAEEVLEVCSVALSLGGTLAASQMTMVVELLQEKGMI